MPRLLKRRTIDLRPGDEVYYRRQWRKIVAAKAGRDAWLTDAEAIEGDSNHGASRIWRRSD